MTDSNIQLAQASSISVKQVADNAQDDQNETTSSEEFLNILQELCEGQIVCDEGITLEFEQKVDISDQQENLLKIFDTVGIEDCHSIDENLMVIPKVLEFDIRQTTDANLNNLLLQDTQEQEESTKIVECLTQEAICNTELKFPFYPMQPENQKHVKNEESVIQYDQIIEGKIFINLHYAALNKKVENVTPIEGFKYNETEYYQNNPQEAVKLPFISADVDITASRRNKEFFQFAYEYKDNCYDLDYENTYTSYFNQQKGILSHKMNFSLETLSNKLTSQVNLTVCNALQSDNKQLVVQLEPAELGKIEVVVDIYGKERNITINADKISTYELLKKCSCEFLDNIRAEDEKSDLSTNLTFNYKDLSQNNDRKQEFNLQGRADFCHDENIDIINGLQPKKVSILFIPIDIDKQLDILV